MKNKLQYNYNVTIYKIIFAIDCVNNNGLDPK